MKTFVVLCTVDASKETERKALRGDHLAYLARWKERIAFGGPLLSDDGHPMTMMIAFHADTRDDVDAFISVEPYTAHGIFSHVDIHPWAQVLPESTPGALDAAIAAERGR
jgi:uncharacterized protein YciI